LRLGIGLALVYELVKLHGGQIRAESAEGKGTTFSVTLPFGMAHLPADHVKVLPTESPEEQRKSQRLKNLEFWWVGTQATKGIEVWKPERLREEEKYLVNP
jgi:hypothetical protein